MKRIYAVCRFGGLGFDGVWIWIDGLGGILVVEKGIGLGRRLG